MSEFKIIQLKGSLKKDEEGDLKIFESWGNITNEKGENIDENSTYNALLIDSNSKMRDRLEILSELVAEIMQKMSLDKKNYADKITEEGLELNQAHMIRSLGRFLGYLFNSTSWQKSELQDYDKFELVKRLEIVKQFLK